MAALHPLTTLTDWLDDLTVRFLLNLPASELSSVPRLCFQVEEAQWFYEDFVRPAVAAAGAPPLPSLPLRQFCLLLFQHCPLLSGFTDAQHIAAYEEFLAYKVRVPVRGAILLDADMEKVLLVRGWKKGASWSFPRGKINKDEKDLDCAVREVWEETGYDARQAGLIPENEDDAKYIDITMREQHMRLFVFRGVPEDTYFEPKTRKEIGKIQWYSIRDLPGFKKQKPHHEGETNANKFYMVAPFLGPLKKWIGQQKRNDKALAAKGVPSNGLAAATTTEDEADLEEEQTHEVEVLVDRKSEDLRRLLSIGQPAHGTQSVPQSAQPPAHTNNLLAMLQGTANPVNTNRPPHTPLEQINAFPQQPISPHPNHLRHPSITQYQAQPPPPQFPLSPQRLQQQEQQHNAPLPTPNIFGPGPIGFPQTQHPGFPGMIPPHILQQQFQQRQGMPGPPGYPFGPQNGLPFNGQQHSGMPLPPPMPPQGIQQHVPGPFQQQPPPNAYLAQGPHGPIGSGPAVPNASQLPPPRLNAQSMKLLDAFKSGVNRPAIPSASSETQKQPRSASTHQSALLDLFKKPAASPSTAVQPAVEAAQEPVSPTLTDVTVKPAGSLERRPTLNEITRTLPAKIKVKSPQTVDAPVQPAPPVAPRSERERPKTGQLFDPSAPTKPKVPNRDVNQSATQPSPPTILQPPQRKSGSKSPRPRHASPAGSPSRRNGSHATPSSSQPAAPFTILARPGSARGPKSPAVPPSPLPSDGQKAPFQPQVLKRPPRTEDVAQEAEQKPADKKDQLLALFGKTVSPPPTIPASQLSSPPTTQDQEPPASTDDRKTALLDLFNSSASPSSQQQPTPISAPPPRAPRIEPERRTSSKTTVHQPSPTATAAPRPQQQQQQNLLLDLFTNRNPSGTPVTSPGTPISPFILGTPANNTAGFGLPPAAETARSRLGSVASVASPGGESSGGTPVEAKEFLMGFLNGVVRKEGGRR